MRRVGAQTYLTVTSAFRERSTFDGKERVSVKKEKSELLQKMKNENSTHTKGKQKGKIIKGEG